MAWWFLTWGIGAGVPAAVGPYPTQGACEIGRGALQQRFPRASTTDCFDGSAVVL